MSPLPSPYLLWYDLGFLPSLFARCPRPGHSYGYPMPSHLRGWIGEREKGVEAMRPAHPGQFRGGVRFEVPGEVSAASKPRIRPIPDNSEAERGSKSTGQVLSASKPGGPHIPDNYSRVGTLLQARRARREVGGGGRDGGPA